MYKDIPLKTNSTEEYYLDSLKRNKLTELDNVNVTNQMIDVEYQRTIEIGEKITTIIGGSYRRNMVEANVFSSVGDIVKKQEGLAAGFAQVEYRPIDKLNLIAGGRFDNHSVVGNNFNPMAAAVLKINEKQNLRASFGTATRNPHFFDLYLDTYMKAADLLSLSGLSPIMHLTGEDRFVIFHVMGNTSNKAEKLTSIELGYNIKIGNNFQTKLDLFYCEMENPVNFTPAEITRSVEKIENLSVIFKSQSPSFTTMHETGEQIEANIHKPIDWDEDMTKDEMLQAITDVQSTIDYVQTNINMLLGMGLPPDAPLILNLEGKKNDLLALKGGFEQLTGAYGIPLEMSLKTENENLKHSFYGGELGFTYIPVANLTLTANYSYLKFSKSYSNMVLSDPYQLYSSPQEIVLINNPEHKINVGLKYRFKGLYAGIMFNWMSESIFAMDYDHDGTYDVDDKDPKYGDGSGTQIIEARVNLNANLGFEYKFLEIFVTGYNLIQDNYIHIPEAYATTKGDPLNRRFIGGIKINF